MPPRVFIIIVNWNGEADTLECLRSLRRDTYENKGIIVVDNGSSDGSVVSIAREFPEVTLIETKCNLGFTGGNNVGIDRALRAGADYLYLLNNDTVSEEGAMSALVTAAQASKEFGLLTPLILYHDAPGDAWFAGSRIDLSRGTAVHDNQQPPSRDGGTVEIAWASGCAMLIPAEVARSLHGFDNRFFLNWEDVDLSLRVRDAGLRVGLVPSARIRHKVSRSLNTVKLHGLYYSVRNNLLLILKHSGPQTLRATCSVLTERLRSCVRAFRRRDPTASAQLLMTWRAVWDHCRGHYGPYSR